MTKVVQANLKHLWVYIVVSFVEVYEVTEQPVPMQLILVQTSSKVLIMYNRTVFLTWPSSSLPSLHQTHTALSGVKE